MENRIHSNNSVHACQNCKKDFTIETNDFNFYEKLKVPPPTWCFQCRLKRKLAYLNLRNLYKRKCDNCNEDMLSMYNPTSPYVVFCQKCYNDTREDYLKYGVDYDFSRPFFEQLSDLYKKVPCVNLKQNDTSINCSYSNYVYHIKNAYLSYMVSRSEDIYYSKQVLMGNKFCVDCEVVEENERGYELVSSYKNYNSSFLVDSSECVDSSFLFDCSNCTNCCLSSNLRNKSYVFRNKQLTREEYLKVMEEFPLSSYKIQDEFKKEFQQIALKAIHRYSIIKNSVDCSGNNINNCKNLQYGFNTIKNEDSKYVVFGATTMSGCYDVIFSGINNGNYEIMDTGGNSNMVRFVNGSSANFDCYYILHCKNDKNLFGCVGLTGKSYCILNKQYTKEKYEEMIPKIIEHMNDMPYIDKKSREYRFGEFFPIEFSPFAYNESLAYEEFLMNKNEVETEGYLWIDREKREYKPTMMNKDLPDNINEVDDSILEEIISCPNRGQDETLCTYAYRIVPEELRFYRLAKIPLPRYCPNCRYYQRRKWLNPWNLWLRKCMNKGCQNEFETSYAPDRPEIVYCEDCYKKEVY